MRQASGEASASPGTSSSLAVRNRVNPPHTTNTYIYSNAIEGGHMTAPPLRVYTIALCAVFFSPHILLPYHLTIPQLHSINIDIDNNYIEQT